MTARLPNLNRRAGIALAVMVAVIAIGIGLAAAFGGDAPPPPPDEYAYVEELFDRAPLFTSIVDVGRCSALGPCPIPK